MGMLKLSNGFSVLPEGETVLYVTGVDYDEKWGKIEIHFINADGSKHSERYKIYKDNGDLNEPALNAFSWIARTILNDPSVEEIDPKSLAGHYVACTVYHEQYTGNDGKARTYAHIKDYDAADAFDRPMNDKARGIIGGKGIIHAPKVAQVEQSEAPVKNDEEFDIDSFLNGEE